MNRLLITTFFIAIQTTELLASPGGKIVKEVFDSPLGKLVGGILFVLLSPFIFLSWYKRNKSIKATKGQLAQLAKIDNELFDEINLKNQMTDVFQQVHKGWSDKNLSDCEEVMTHWYRQNQQSVFLDKWSNKNLVNMCTIRNINSIKPIHLRITDLSGFEGSRIMFAIDANMEDYLMNVEDSTILEGKKGFKNVETVWTLKLDHKAWKVDDIEQSDMISSYIKTASLIPDSVLSKLSINKAV